MWTVVYSKQAVKDSKKIEQSNLKETVKKLIEVLKNDPFQNPPPYEKLIGDLAGSIYEYEQLKKIKPVRIKNIIEKNSFYSDDTILTIAVLEAVLNNKNYEKYLRDYIMKFSNYKPNFTPYFDTAFSKKNNRLV